MFQLQIVVSNLLHQICSLAHHARSISLLGHFWYNQKRRWWWRRRKSSFLTHSTSSYILFVLFLNLVKFISQVFIQAFFSMSLGLLHDGFLHDDIDNFFIIEILFGKIERVEQILPLWRNILGIKCAWIHIESYRVSFFYVDDYTWDFFILIFFISEKPFDFIKEAALFFLFLFFLQPPLF